MNRHHRKYGEKAFLEFPYCTQGIFPIPLLHEDGSGTYMKFVFNLEKTTSRLRKDVKYLLSSSDSFLMLGGIIPNVKIGAPDSGEGITDMSYRGRLELTRELIKRAKENS